MQQIIYFNCLLFHQQHFALLPKTNNYEKITFCFFGYIPGSIM